MFDTSYLKYKYVCILLYCLGIITLTGLLCYVFNNLWILLLLLLLFYNPTENHKKSPKGLE